MELQLALDFITIDGAKKLLKEIGNGIDIVEIGTPFIVKDGVKAISEIKREFPDLKILADLKIMDAGEYETKAAIEAGADIVTVLGASNDATIRASVVEAKKFNKSIMVDMIDVLDIEKRAKEIDELGVDYICVHTAFDVQSTGKNPLEELLKVKRVVKKTGIAVAGGIKLDTIGEIVKAGPDIVIVGGGITGQPDKRKAALAMKAIMSI
ncbi:3-hexulose-6-phosphate synthase [Oscillospiraceae bacterium PP1C4]